MNLIPSSEVSCNTGNLLSGICGRGTREEEIWQQESHFENVAYMNRERGYKYNDFYETMGLKNGVAGPKCSKQEKAPDVCPGLFPL